jgi:hypothetical protein
MGVKSLVKLLTKAAPEAADKMQLSTGAKAALDASMAARPEISAKWSTTQQQQAITAWQDALMKQTGADPVDVESAAYGMLKFKMSNNLAMEEPMTIPYLKHQKDKGDWDSIMQIMKAYDNDSFFAEIKPPGDYTPAVATPDEVLKESYLQYQQSPHYGGENISQFKEMADEQIDYYIDAWKEGVSLGPLELKMQSSMANAEVAAAAKAIGLKYVPTWKPVPANSIEGSVAKVLQENKFSPELVEQMDSEDKAYLIIDLLASNSWPTTAEASTILAYHGSKKILNTIKTHLKDTPNIDFNEVVELIVKDMPDDLFEPIGKNYQNAGAPEGWGSTGWTPPKSKVITDSNQIMAAAQKLMGEMKTTNPITAKSPGFKMARKVADVITDADGLHVSDWKNVVVNFSKFLSRESKLHPSDIREIEDFFTISSAHPADIIDDAVASNFSIADMQKLLIEVTDQWKNHEISGYTAGTWRDFIGYTTEELMKMGPVTNRPIPPSLRDSWRFPTEEDYGLIIVKSPEDKAVFDAMHMVRGTFNRLSKSVQEERFNGRKLGLNDMDIAAINFYTHTGDGWQNWRLRYPEEWKKRHPEEYEYEQEQLDLIVKRTNEALDKLPDHFDVVYRSTSIYGMEAENLADMYRVGDVLPEMAYTSTSLKERSGGIEYVVLSKTGKLIRKISEYKTEEEVLFRPGTQFRVIHKEVVGQNSKGNDKSVIYLEEI